METNISRGLQFMATAIMTILLSVNSGFAATPDANNAETNGPAIYPHSMYRDMGPGNMPYGHMGQGYMHHGRGYGGMGYGRGMMEYGMGFGGMGMMRALNLSKEQRTKIRSLMREQRAAHCKAMTEMFDVRDELAAEYDKDQPDPKAVGRLYDKMAEMQKHMLEQSVQMHNKMRGLLNKEQKETFDRMFHGTMGFGLGYGGMGMMHMMDGGMMRYGEW